MCCCGNITFKAKLAKDYRITETETWFSLAKNLFIFSLDCEPNLFRFFSGDNHNNLAFDIWRNFNLNRTFLWTWCELLSKQCNYFICLFDSQNILIPTTSLAFHGNINFVHRTFHLGNWAKFILWGSGGNFQNINKLGNSTISLFLDNCIAIVSPLCSPRVFNDPISFFSPSD